jgi:hypothetical protein
VLTVMNSTPFSPCSIMRLTALQPPPPTPITLILRKHSPGCLGYVPFAPLSRENIRCFR